MTTAGSQVFVTGADGFIGSHLVERLVLEGHRVRALALYNSHQSAGWLDTIEPKVRESVDVVFGDVRDKGFIERAMVGQELVFHLAALISIPHSYDAPQSFLDTNVIGTFNILEAARTCDVQRVVVTSTSEVYGTPETVPITIHHALNAQSPYAASKIAGDQLAMAYAASFSLPVVILRPFNTFGPRQSPRAVITSVLTQMLAGSNELQVGSMHPRRDFTFVSDTVEGFVLMGSADIEPGETIQLGTGRAVSIGEVIERAAMLVGWHGQVVIDQQRVRPDTSEVQILLADPTSAEVRIGWSPKVEFEQGLSTTCDWLARQEKVPDVNQYFR